MDPDPQHWFYAANCLYTRNRVVIKTFSMLNGIQVSLTIGRFFFYFSQGKMHGMFVASQQADSAIFLRKSPSLFLRTLQTATL
jgi:hypothetical protein